jgi:hypothetical protein
MPVNASATWNGCDRKRSIRRACPTAGTTTCRSRHSCSSRISRNERTVSAIGTCTPGHEHAVLVDRDRRLAGLAVADDELALAAADRDHRVDRLDAGLQRLVHRLARDHARGLELGGPRVVGVDLALAVERIAERVDDPAQQRVADRGLQQSAVAPDRVTLDDPLPRAEQHGADVVGLEVQREPGHPVRQLEHLERHAVRQAVDAGDAVRDRQHRADLAHVRLSRVEAFDAALEDGGDLVWLDPQWDDPFALRSCGVDEEVSVGGDDRACHHAAVVREGAPKRSVTRLVMSTSCDEHGTVDSHCRAGRVMRPAVR